jgi:hypothetical protein
VRSCQHCIPFNFIRSTINESVVFFFLRRLIALSSVSLLRILITASVFDVFKDDPRDWLRREMKRIFRGDELHTEVPRRYLSEYFAFFLRGIFFSSLC